MSGNTSDDNYKLIRRLCKYLLSQFPTIRVVSVIPRIRIVSLNFTEEKNADVTLVVRTGYIATLIFLVLVLFCFVLFWFFFVLFCFCKQWTCKMTTVSFEFLFCLFSASAEFYFRTFYFCFDFRFWSKSNTRAPVKFMHMRRTHFSILHFISEVQNIPERIIMVSTTRLR